MPTSSSPLPYLPLEVKNHILRFCDPSTLAKTAQVSLAFLELSSPILYEDVHIHGFRNLKLLFSMRFQPPSLQIAPFLSLSQIRDLSLYPTLGEVQVDHIVVGFGCLDRAPSNSPIPIRTLGLFLPLFLPPQTSTEACRNPHLPPFSDLVDPRRLRIKAPPGPDTRLYLGWSHWDRLETATFTSISFADDVFSETSKECPRLSNVVYDFSEDAGERLESLITCLALDLPLGESSELVVEVKVGSEEHRKQVLAKIQMRFEGKPSRERVMDQLRVTVKQ